MAFRLTCPCGTVLYGDDADGIVVRAQSHLAQVHAGREYSANEILLMAVPVPDRLAPRTQ